MDGKRREEKAQDEHKPKEKKAYGYEKSNQKWSYQDYVKFCDEAERKQKKKAESKAKDEKAKVSEFSKQLLPISSTSAQSQGPYLSSTAPKACTPTHYSN